VLKNAGSSSPTGAVRLLSLTDPLQDLLLLLIFGSPLSQFVWVEIMTSFEGKHHVYPNICKLQLSTIYDELRRCGICPSVDLKRKYKSLKNTGRKAGQGSSVAATSDN